MRWGLSWGFHANSLYTLIYRTETDETRSALGSWAMGQAVSGDLWEQLHHHCS